MANSRRMSFTGTVAMTLLIIEAPSIAIVAPLPHARFSGVIDISVRAPANTKAVIYSIDGLRISQETDAYARATHTPPIWMTATDAAWLAPGPHTLSVEAQTAEGAVTASEQIFTNRAPAPAGEISLDGRWNFAAAPDIAANRWTPVLVPDSFGALDPAWDVYNGILGEYRRTVDLPAPRAGERTWLVMESCAWRCTVRVNGAVVGMESGGYLPARFDVTNAVRTGANAIAVDADTRVQTIGNLAGFMVDYWNWGGIFQSIRLERTPPVTLTAVTALGATDGTLTIHATGVNALGTQRNVPLLVRVQDANGHIVYGPQRFSVQLPANGGETAPLRLHVADPQLWDLNHPYLYTLAVTPLDTSAWRTFVVHTGFRDITVHGSDLYLNGRVVSDLQGFNRHADYPGLGHTQPDELADREIKRLHDRGFRIFRPAHYPTTQAELDAADRYGLLVIEEINVTGESGSELHDPRVLSFARDRLHAMIERDRGHPSIFAWSVGNENATDTAWGADYVRDLIAFGRKLDPARLFAEVSNRYTKDQAYSYEDFVATNLYAGWYGGMPAATLDKDLNAIQAASGAKPILISEYGAEAVHDRPGFGRGTEFYQAWIVDEYNRILAHRPHFIGKLYWLASEFIVSPTWAGGNPNPVPPFHTKALLTYYREPKLAWRVMFSPVRLTSSGFSAQSQGYAATVDVRNVSGAEVRGTLITDPPSGWKAQTGDIPFTLAPGATAAFSITLGGTGSLPADGIIRAVIDAHTEAMPLRIVPAATGGDIRAP
jgi:hypothetical protein